MNISHKRGFTLIELLVVIAIIGVLAGVVLTSLGTARAKARDTQKISNLKNIQLALELYADANNGLYPEGSATVTAAVCYGLDDLVPTYLPVLPASAASGQCDYRYSASSDERNYHLGVVLEQDSAVLDADNDKDGTSYTGADFHGNSVGCIATAISGAEVETCYDLAN